MTIVTQPKLFKCMQSAYCQPYRLLHRNGTLLGFFLLIFRIQPEELPKSCESNPEHWQKVQLGITLCAWAPRNTPVQNQTEIKIASKKLFLKFIHSKYRRQPIQYGNTRTVGWRVVSWFAERISVTGQQWSANALYAKALHIKNIAWKKHWKVEKCGMYDNDTIIWL